MPSRPVLIGRGLVPTPYKTNHHNRLHGREARACATKQPHTWCVCPRPHAVPNQHTHRVWTVTDKTTEQLNSSMLGTPPTNPDNTGSVSGCVCSARVTAAIAKGKHPVPYRTRKLSLSAPMVLQPRGCGRVGRRRTYIVEEGSPLGGPSSAFLDTLGARDGGEKRATRRPQGWPRLRCPQAATVMGRVVGSGGEGRAWR